jgi:hypothetical protein
LLDRSIKSRRDHIIFQQERITIKVKALLLLNSQLLQGKLIVFKAVKPFTVRKDMQHDGRRQGKHHKKDQGADRGEEN